MFFFKYIYKFVEDTVIQREIMNVTRTGDMTQRTGVHVLHMGVGGLILNTLWSAELYL